MVLRESTKFLIHVAKGDSGKEGSHFAIMKFKLDKKCIKVFVHQLTNIPFRMSLQGWIQETNQVI